jgi:hypothetical protein
MVLESEYLMCLIKATMIDSVSVLFETPDLLELAVAHLDCEHCCELLVASDVLKQKILFN